jgi:hypothetical protein
MDSLVPIEETNDLSVFTKEIAYNKDGTRLVRVMDLGHIALVDTRDMGWILDEYTSLVWGLKFSLFWTQVALGVAMAHKGAPHAAH